MTDLASRWCVALLAAVSGCSASRGQQFYFGQDCPKHTYANLPVERRRAQAPEIATFAPSRSAVVLHVFDAKTRAPIAQVWVRLIAGIDTQVASTDLTGTVRSAPQEAGVTQLEVRMLAYRSVRDTVRLRAGFVDTVHLGLGLSPNCLWASRAAVRESRASGP